MSFLTLSYYLLALSTFHEPETNAHPTISPIPGQGEVIENMHKKTSCVQQSWFLRQFAAHGRLRPPPFRGALFEKTEKQEP